MTPIQSNLTEVLHSLNPGVTLVGVSKYHPVEDLQQAYDAGLRDFGENIVQELRTKQPQLPADIRWHFIGHLQTNKVKYIAPYVSLIQSVDSLKLLTEINRQASLHNRTIDYLLQIHVAQEETKFGFLPSECDEMIKSESWRSLHNVRLRGVMCMATNTDDEQRILSDFERAYQFFTHLKQEYFSNNPEFNIRSYGMSDDYPLAIAQHSNMVRIGTRIFGPRQY